MRRLWSWSNLSCLYIEAQGCVPVLLEILHGVSCSGTCWPLGGAWFQCRYGGVSPVPLPGKSPGWRSLVGCSPCGRWELDTTQWLHFHFLLSCIGEGNGNPLQCSCLENPRGGIAWWVAVYGVAQSWTWWRDLAAAAAAAWRSLMSSCWLMSPGVRSSLMFSGFGLKSPASGFQFYFYSSFKTSPSVFEDNDLLFWVPDILC